MVCCPGLCPGVAVFVCPCLVPRGRTPLSVSYSLLGAPPTTHLSDPEQQFCLSSTGTPPFFCSSPSLGCAPSFTFALFLCSPLPFGPRATSAQPPCHLVPPSLYAHHIQDRGETLGRSWCYKTLPLRQGLFLLTPCLVFLALMRTLSPLWSRGLEEPQASSNLTLGFGDLEKLGRACAQWGYG